MKLLRCPQAVAIDCKAEGEFLKVGVLLVKEPSPPSPLSQGGEGGQEGQTATLYDADTEQAYPVRIPPAGCYYAVLLERLPDAPTL